MSWEGPGWGFSSPRAKCPVGRLCGKGLSVDSVWWEGPQAPLANVRCVKSVLDREAPPPAWETVQALGSHRPGMGAALIWTCQCWRTLGKLPNLSEPPRPLKRKETHPLCWKSSRD